MGHQSMLGVASRLKMVSASMITHMQDDETADVPMVAVRAQGEPLFGAQAYNHARTRAQIRGIRAELRDGPCNGGRYGEP